MADFFRKNMTLVVFLGIALIAAAVLVVMDVDRYHKIADSIRKIEEGGKAIREINSLGEKAPEEFQDDPEKTYAENLEDFKKWNERRKNPRIVKENADLILQDAEELKTRTWQTQRIYGQAYDAALNLFFKAVKDAKTGDDNVGKALEEQLKELDFAKLNATFAALIKGREQTVVNLAQEQQAKLFDELRAAAFKAPRKLNDEEKKAFETQAVAIFDKGFENFVAEVQKQTCEPLTGEGLAAGKALFLQAVGLQRSFSDGMEFSAYCESYCRMLIKNKSIPAADQELSAHDVFVILRSVDKKEMVSPNPPKDNIPHIVRRFQIYEDLFARMKTAGIIELLSLKKEGNIYGERNGDYRTYSFRVAVRGTLPQIRKFVNSMHQAYKDNRVYSISNFTLDFNYTEAENAATATAGNAEINQSLKVMRDYLAVAQARERQQQEIKEGKANPNPAGVKPVDETDSPDYGAASLGVNNQIVASFDFDYIIYVGDAIPKDKAR